MQRQLVADQTLWRRLPAKAAALFWPVEVVLLGWGAGWWAGLVTVLLLGAASTVLPPRLKVSIYLVDLLERLLRLPLEIGWLLLVWHLWQREPVLAPLGQPLAGAVIAAALFWALTRLLAFLSRFAARRVMSNE